MEISSILGTFFGIFSLLSGQVAQGTAALVVFAGTLGAVFLSFPAEDLRLAFRMLPLVYKNEAFDPSPAIEDMIRVATVARKEGVLAIESARSSLRDPLLRQWIKYVIDGFSAAAVREIIEAEINLTLKKEENAARVFEGASGFAQRMGIFGAALSLIHALSMTHDLSGAWAAIPVALGAIASGFGIANLCLMPWGNKLKRKAQQRAVLREVLKVGVVGILDGLNPHFLEERLRVYIN